MKLYRCIQEIDKIRNNEEAQPGPQRAVQARPRTIFEQFWFHVGVMLGSFWCHFWYFRLIFQ